MMKIVTKFEGNKQEIFIYWRAQIGDNIMQKHSQYHRVFPEAEEKNMKMKREKNDWKKL